MQPAICDSSADDRACVDKHGPVLQQMRGRLGDNWERISRMSIIEEGYGGEKCACLPAAHLSSVIPLHVRACVDVEFIC